MNKSITTRYHSNCDLYMSTHLNLVVITSWHKQRLLAMETYTSDWSCRRMKKWYEAFTICQPKQHKPKQILTTIVNIFPFLSRQSFNKTVSHVTIILCMINFTLVLSVRLKKEWHITQFTRTNQYYRRESLLVNIKQETNPVLTIMFIELVYQCAHTIIPQLNHSIE